MKQIITENAPKAIGPYSQGLVAGNLVFVSGQIPIDPTTGIMPETVEEQAKQVLKNLTGVLAEEGLTMKKPAAKSSDRRVMFDAEVAAFLGISKKTLQNRVARPVKGEIDLNAAKPQRIGNRRLWLREEVERLVGIKKGVTK